MEIVTARREDIPAVAAMEAESFPLGPDAAALERMRAGGGCVILCAREGAALLGFGYFQYVMDEGYLGDLAVAADHRRQGVGGALLAALLRKARDLGLAFLTLEVRESNLPAIGLYKKYGFAPVGARKNYYERPRENALLMTADLGGEETGC